MPEETLKKVPVDSVEFMETNSRYVPSELRQTKKKMLAGYYAHIEALDEQVGRLMKKLEASGLQENTIVVFTSDHGDMLGNHDAYFKSQPWRESVGIPLLMRWPQHIPAGRVTNGSISIVDMMPTLLSLTGTPIPSGVQGVDLSHFVKGDESAAAESVFINFLAKVKIIPQPPFRGVVTRTHTYAETEEGPWLMYDDEKDFFQQNNLITWANRDQLSITLLQKTLSDQVKEWMKRTDDSGIWGDEVNDRFQPGHVGGVLPHVRDPEFSKHKQAWLNKKGNKTSS
jgi:arylsulfatase A-like enzyme